VTVADVTGALQRVRTRGKEPVKPGETRWVPLERVDVQQEDAADPAYRRLERLTDALPAAWTAYDEVAATVARVTRQTGPSAEVNVHNMIREAVLCGLLNNRRNAQGVAEVRRNPDPPQPKTQSELLEEQVERQAAEERRIVQNEMEARERVGREHAERVIAVERATTREHVQPVIDELRGEIRQLRELIETKLAGGE
jgi:hypothetical protein